jgi:hypothetical protein
MWRLGFVGVLSVLVRVDANDKATRIVDVKLQVRSLPS